MVDTEVERNTAVRLGLQRAVRDLGSLYWECDQARQMRYESYKLCCNAETVDGEDRKSCYSEYEWPKEYFGQCDFNSYERMFECCDEIAKGVSEDMALQCKTSLPGGGTCVTGHDCFDNYYNGMRQIEQEHDQKAAIIASQQVDQKESDSSSESEIESWVLAVFAIAVPLVLVIAFVIVILMTRCFQQPLCKRKPQGQKADNGDITMSTKSSPEKKAVEAKVKMG